MHKCTGCFGKHDTLKECGERPSCFSGIAQTGTPRPAVLCCAVLHSFVLCEQYQVPQKQRAITEKLHTCAQKNMNFYSVGRDLKLVVLTEHQPSHESLLWRTNRTAGSLRDSEKGQLAMSRPGAFETDLPCDAAQIGVEHLSRRSLVTGGSPGHHLVPLPLTLVGRWIQHSIQWESRSLLLWKQKQFFGEAPAPWMILFSFCPPVSSVARLLDRTAPLNTLRWFLDFQIHLHDLNEFIRISTEAQGPGNE